MDHLFKPVDVEASGLAWFSWNDDLREQLYRHAHEFSALATRIIDLQPGQNYRMSYASAPDQQLSAAAADTVVALADRLSAFEPHNDLCLLKDLVDERFDAQALHRLFALVSDHIRCQESDPLCSFHSPIVEKTQDRGFPVHADLYRAKGLLNVITKAPEGAGGEITLLSLVELVEVMRQVEMPEPLIELISEILTARHQEDLFDRIYSLMYGNHPWSNRLSQAIQARQWHIDPQPGTGYLLLDGFWLHGRTAIDGPVQESRLQRLVFDTDRTRALPFLHPDALAQLPPAVSTVQKAKAYKSLSRRHNRQWLSESEMRVVEVEAMLKSRPA